VWHGQFVVPAASQTLAGSPAACREVGQAYSSLERSEKNSFNVRLPK